MTRRWSLITAIAVLTVALAFVVTQLVRGQGSGESGKGQAGAEPASPGAGAESLRGVGWWPLHRSGTAKEGEHDAVVSGGTQWTDGPEGGALRLDGTSGFADTGSRIDTEGKDYSVAARVRLTPEDLNGVHTALSQDGNAVSTFFLQYSGQDENFAFSFPGARTVAEKTGQPQTGRWYHLTGTYSRKDHRMRIYVDGRLAGSRGASSKVKPTGAVVVGRGKFGGKAADHWKGDIADVHVYDRELTPGEVKSLSSREPD
ncbi:LamG domain-containing protein [Streptomyces sp. SID8375]|uniref:LamG domain-containing protein n=1 Tax=unclassified Streptomyces TaxID=2593676 RepID=UPI00037BC903|nr:MULTISPECIES: LamG domain-containing protein [unclassified Streptomyces]MYX07812.1 LamG domain-containing protein [Streptomyces sp. SID8375]